jgi:hypothetical protein
MKKIFSFVLLIHAFIITAQTPNLSWVKSMGSTGSDISNAIAVDASGNIYTTGSFSGTVDFDPGAGINNLVSSGNNDVFISKLSPSGNFIWALRCGGTQSDIASGITTDAAGNVYVTGYFTSSADLDPTTATSTFTSFGATDIFIVKLGGAGNFIWARQLGGSSGDEGKSVTVNASGNVFSTGFFSGTADFDPGIPVTNLVSTASGDVFVSKLDASGNFVWAKGFGNIAFDTGASIALDASGNVYTTGNFGSMVDFDPGAGTFSLTSAGAGDAFISKLDAAGNFVWAKQLGGTANDAGKALTIDASGNIYSGGYFFTDGDFDPGPATSTLTSNGVGDIYVSKLDAAGNFVWAKNMGGPEDDFAHALTIDASGNVYTTGFFADTADFDPGAGTYTLISVFPSNPSLIRDQAFICKLDNAGNFVWAGAIGAIKGYGIVATTSEIYTAGFYTGQTDFDPSIATFTLAAFGSDDIFIHKMSQTSVGITEHQVSSGTSIFPNPASGIFYVHTTKVSDLIIITNVLGNEVIKLSPTSTTEAVDSSELANGVYFVKSIIGPTQHQSKLILSK